MKYLNNLNFKVLLLEENSNDFRLFCELFDGFIFNSYELIRVKTLNEFLDKLNGDIDICLVGRVEQPQEILNLREKVFPNNINKPIILLGDSSNLKIYQEALLKNIGDYLEKWDFDAKSFERIILHTIQLHQILSDLNEKNNKYQTLIEALPVMFYSSEIKHPYKLTYVSPSYSIFGYDLGDWTSKPNFWENCIHPDDKTRILEETNSAMLSNKETDYEYRIIGSDGSIFWVHDCGKFYHNHLGKIESWQGMMSDITKRKKTEEKLVHQALFDQITNLPNRTNFLQQLNSLTKDFSSNFAVFIIDVDRFKSVNDSLGHPAGDAVLVEISKRLTRIIRKTDVLARFGGDEFAVLLKNIDNLEEATAIAKKMLKAVNSPFVIENTHFSITISVGITLGGKDNLSYLSTEKYLRDADMAMYEAKSKGKNCYAIYNHLIHLKNFSRFQIENDLKSALQNNELSLHYQPIVCIKSGKIKKLEVLARWNHPIKGAISPTEFIPIAEESNLIVQLGAWGFQEACQQLMEWQKKYQLAKDIIMSINLSAKQLAFANFPEELKKILQETQISPKSINLEIVETIIVKHEELQLQLLNTIDNMGIDICIDDFGIGYSSLSYLHSLPIKGLKIDRSFIQNIGFDEKSEKIINTIIQMANSLGCSVVAEGIETAQQRQYLLEKNVQYGQGFFFSKPLPPNDLENIIKNNLSLPKEDFSSLVSQEIEHNISSVQ